MWRYKLTFVGAERMYVCMEPPSTHYTCWGFDVYHGRSRGRETSGMWAYEGRPVPNAEGESKSWRSALQSFVTSASFWENGVHEWETNDVRSRATYTEEVKEPQWQASGLHGLHTP